jgi:nucleotide-binding universal stress UspA family protein
MANGRLERTLERKLTLAKEVNSWVIQANVPETRMFLRMARDIDRAMRILRSGLMLRFKPEEVLPLFNELYEEARRLNEVVKRLCEKAGIPYREPLELSVVEGRGVGGVINDYTDEVLEEEEDIRV